METLLYILTLIVLTVPLGVWIAKVGTDSDHFVKRYLGWLEQLIYQIIGINPSREMTWPVYLLCVLVFNGLGILILTLILLCQGGLPFNPQHFPGLDLPLALSTAVSFVTNTNWQAYSGEASLSYFSQCIGLVVENFLSAATGIAIFFALARGIAATQEKTLGNFWADLTRITLYILLPLSIIFGIFLVSQGVVQSFSEYQQVNTLEGAKQTIPLGPAASQIAIKQLGTNGGGFFGQNSAHPFENPTPLSNFIQLLAILLIPAALPFAYGKIIGRPREGLALFAAMLLIFMIVLGCSLLSEYSLPINMEGKEVRFGVQSSVLWSVATTAASNGSVNAMHTSLSPLSGLIAMLNIMLGEVIFGGVGSGMYGILMHVILTVFLAGLMVGRSPEYLGKKIERNEVILAVIAVLIPSAAILIGTALSCYLPAGLAGRSSAGPHGLSEMLYAWTSAAGNNGSAFAGLNANTTFYNLGLGIAMLIGRYGVIIPCLAVSGCLCGKKVTPPSAGTFHTDTFTFVVLLISVIVIVGGLTFIPVLTIGPIAEHLTMINGILF